MEDYGFPVKRILGHIGILGLLICVGAYFLGYGSIIAGFAIGLAVGISFFLLLYYQIGNFAGIAKENAVPYMRCGWLVRLIVLIIMLVLLGHIPPNNILAAIVGFFLPPVLIFMNAIAVVVQQIIASRKLS